MKISRERFLDIVFDVFGRSGTLSTYSQVTETAEKILEHLKVEITEDQSLEDRLRQNARMSGASKAVCQLMEDAADRISELEATKVIDGDQNAPNDHVLVPIEDLKIAVLLLSKQTRPDLPPNMRGSIDRLQEYLK